MSDTPIEQKEGRSHLFISAVSEGNVLIKNGNIRWLMIPVSTAYRFSHKAINAARRNGANNARGCLVSLQLWNHEPLVAFAEDLVKADRQAM
jgi:hypothetical protein